MVFTPPETVDEILGRDSYGNPAWYTSENTFYGYHFAYINNHDYDTYYAVIAFPGQPNAVFPGPERLQQITATASHELVEAVADAIPDIQADGDGGWFADKGTVIESAEEDIAVSYAEIADLGEEPDGNGGWLLSGGFAELDGYTIQLYFSNASGQCYLPSGAVRLNVRSPIGGGESDETDMEIDDTWAPANSNASSSRCRSR